jgi:hypothetical protein
MTRMPSLVRPVYLASLVFLVVAAAGAAAAVPASAAFPSIEITIVSPDGDEAQVWLDQVENPEIETTYYVRSRGRTTPIPIEHGEGISVRQILAEKQFDLGYGTLEIKRPDGTTLVLSKDDIDSRLSPTFYVKDDGQVWFVRPSTGSTDYNTRDNFPIKSAAVTLTQTPAGLTVSVKASRKKIDVGESIKFTTKVSGAPRNARLIYIWDFDDGKRISDGDRNESHQFDKECACHVQVNVKILGESRSDPSNVVKVQVGDPKESGKDRQGGGDNTADDAPDSGTSTGSSGADSIYDGGSTYTPVPDTPPPPAPTPDSTEPDIATSGTPVEGNLLADVSDPPPSNILESARRAARDGTPKDESADVGVSEAALSIVGALALLGLGAGLETRQGRLPRLRLPRRAA